MDSRLRAQLSGINSYASNHYIVTPAKAGVYGKFIDATQYHSLNINNLIDTSASSQMDSRLRGNDAVYLGRIDKKGGIDFQ